jgi:DNA-binding NarL/FixJ family response regulator
MPRLDGIEAMRLILSDLEAGHARVLILTTFDLDEYVYGALRAGASGFLLKDAPPKTCSMRSESLRPVMHCWHPVSRGHSSKSS